MRVRVVREVDVKTDSDSQQRKIVASRWWALVPRDMTEAQHKIFEKKAKIVTQKSTPEEVCYYFGDHLKGALATAWDCMQKASELS